MARVPFYKVVVQKNGRDISDKISKLSFEDAVDVDNLLTLHINTQNVADLDDEDLKVGGFINKRSTAAGTKVTKFLQYLDDVSIKEGSILTVYFGFVKGKSSPPISMRVSNHRPTYAENINLVIEATDLGILLKKTTSKKDWSKMRSSDIAKQIALANSLVPVVDATTRVHTFMPQGGRSDYDFLKYLASIETHGSWRFYLRGDELHFTRLALEKPSSRTFTYADGNDIVKAFRPNSVEMLKKGASRNTILTTVDPFTNVSVQRVINDTSAKDDVKLGDYNINFNENAEQISTSSGKRPSQVQAARNDPSRAGQHISIPITEEGEMDDITEPSYGENLANKVKKQSALKDYTASLETDGDPDFVADEIITMGGVAKRDLGNWYVERVTHEIDQSGGYGCRFTLNKNAAEVKIPDNAALQSTTNKTVGERGDVEKQKEVQRIYFNEDSIEIPKPK